MQTAMDRRGFLRALGAGAMGVALNARAAAGAKTRRPNFIFYITDDISWNDLACYGHPVAQTPALDAMAQEGVVFENAYLTISSCSPSRCSIITGRYPHNTGAPELHTALPTDQAVFPQRLREAGYYTLLSGKNHMGDVRRAFDVIDRGQGPGAQENWVELLRDRPKDKPFFFWLASKDAHRGWTFTGEAPRYDPDAMRVPPYLYDGPKTRQDLADYFHEVSRCDYYAGKLREELERQGIADNTYVVFCGDNGRPFPRCKTRLYDDGIKTPLIVWAPGQLAPARTEAFVSSVDFAATFLDLAGLEPMPTSQGVSFKPLLEDPAAAVRDYVFAEHNWHVFQAHERMVRWRDWVYIRNAWPERMNLCVEGAPEFPAGEELWQAEEDGKLKPEQRDIFLKPRPAEELYNVAQDPDQLDNLAQNPAHQAVLEKLRAILDAWTQATGDDVPDNPTNDRQDAHGNRFRAHKRGAFPGAAHNAAAVNRPGPIRETGR